MRNFQDNIFIVAEIGINHNGDIKLAKKLIDKAKICGANAVKFQIYNTDLFLTKNYSNLSLKRKKNFLHMKRVLEKNSLTYEEFKELKLYATKKKISFSATPFDLNSLIFLKKLKPKFIKLASADLNNYELLNEVCKSKFPLILSTGMSDKNEIDNTLNYLKKNRFSNYSLMHCVSVYPTPFNLINLNSIPFLKKKYKCKIGFSDHSSSIDIPVYSVILGAKIIEKHFTLNTKMSGPDHKSSLDPNSFKNMIEKIRNLKSILGKFDKQKNSIEKKFEWIAKRGVYAKKNIRKGEKFDNSNVSFMRPQIYLKKKNTINIYNIKAKKNYLKGDPII